MTTIAFGIFGLFVLIGIAWSLSNHRDRVDWRLVVSGIGLQLLLILLVEPLSDFGASLTI